MNDEVVCLLGQWIRDDTNSVASGKAFSVGKRVNNISVQTGEEFSMEFLHDRAATGMVSISGRPDLYHQDHANRMGLNSNQNHDPGYEDLTGILGVRRIDSECCLDVSDVSIRKGQVTGAAEKGFLEKGIKSDREAGGNLSSNSLEEMNFNSLTPGNMVQMSSFPSENHHGLQPSCGSETSDSSHSGKMKFLCSFGGRILPRPSDGNLRYVGGDTRIITIEKNISWQELRWKTFGICNQLLTIKYQLPGEDLDALISVSSDEDLQNMIEEYHGLEWVEGSKRLRIFLISSSESENGSFDAEHVQSNSEYNYVAAVNGLQKSSSAHHLVGHNLESAPSFQKESSPSLPRLDLKESPSLPDLVGMFVHPSGQLFIASQNSPTNSPLSSPIQRKDSRNALKQLCEDQLHHVGNENIPILTDHSPLFSPIQRKDSINALKQLCEDQLHHVGSENIPVLMDQQLENYHVIDFSYHPYGEEAKHLPNSTDAEHFHNCTHSRDFAPPYGCDNSGLAIYSVCEKPALTERTFHSEKFQRCQEDSLNQFSESNDDSQHGMPHALSDSQLQELGGRHVYCFQEGAPPPLVFSAAASTLPVSQNILQGVTELREDIKLVNSSHTKLANTMAIHPMAHDVDEEHLTKETTDWGSRNQHEKHEFNPEISTWMDGEDVPLCQGGTHHDIDFNRAPLISKCRSKLLGIDCHPPEMLDVQVSQQQLQSSESKVPTSPFTVSEAYPNNIRHFVGIQDDKISSELSFINQSTTKDQQCGTSELSGSDLVDNGYTDTKSLTSFPWSMNSRDVVAPEGIPDSSTKWHYDEGNASSSILHGPSGNLASNVSPGVLSVASSEINNKPESRVVNSNPIMKEPIRGEAYHFDQDPMNNGKIKEVDGKQYHYEPSKGADGILINIGPQNDFDEQVQQESSVLVEDVTDNVPSDIHSEIGDMPSPKVTEVESASESEEGKADDGETDEPINDAAIAEMEASIYGLQIIKNADLEELRELGSGTFGTVYHGKWRGTDVAIKRIKKSCFSGRSSEQERLTKDFWREAQILSKLHHPNVVAFYGVVPDGAGGTLATVTEFMVNGSLKHVLLRKDRELDHRKRLIIAMDAAFGMEYLHSKNIVHFDLKCDNLLVNMRDSQRPICKVGDFGLSRIKRSTLVSGGVRGTLPWMAPELLNGSSSGVSEKVDVFSFGIAMWEILTGEEPYSNMHCGAIIGGIVNNTLRPLIPDCCDPEWRKLMEHCWSPDPAARPSFTEITYRLRVMSASLQSKS
ncbi:Serine/threonine-protein kinase [Cinnamomum micranthum f. kanehirae]|uniref:Serine/threonine-protein kinase n=1 Tax=Cinnamomum micranthum f. kanehirae TaxID=337451 RepID=A0A3S3R8I1_9MAGN|nr:Serine/threonine-protein kinase [Cinnamomum micranthum f. kanehirae]